MTLIDRIFHEGDGPHFINHALGSIVRTWLVGDRTNGEARTAAEAVLTLKNNGQAYTFTQGELDAFLEFKSHYDGLPNNDAKLSYIAKVEGILGEAELGTDVTISRAKFKSILGLT